MNHHEAKEAVDLTQGSIVRGILDFSFPVFLGQLLQQFYNLVDAWVIGNFASTQAFAAISSTSTIVFLIIGFFGGTAIGGSVVISRYYGAGSRHGVSTAVHTNFLMGLLMSAAGTVLGLLLTPHILVWIGTPEEVMPYARTYLMIYFGGVSTVMMYNVGMSIMRALGDSLHPLYYLIVSSFINVALDLVLVARPFHFGIGGAAAATVISQGISAVLCIRRLTCLKEEYLRLDFRKIRWDGGCMREVVGLGIPTGVQNAVLTVGNLVVQKNVNSFGTAAMSGFGAYTRIEQIVFLPIMSMSMAVTTFVSQNLGAGQYGRAVRGARFATLFGVISAELFGVLCYFLSPYLIRIFTQDPQSIEYGVLHAHIAALFYCVLAFSHCAAGIMRGCGRATVPMFVMLSFWCVFRIIYVTLMMAHAPVYQSVASAYPVTWTLSSLCFAYFLFFTDWLHYYEKKRT